MLCQDELPGPKNSLMGRRFFIPCATALMSVEMFLTSEFFFTKRAFPFFYMIVKPFLTPKLSTTERTKICVGLS